jgi:hypothetical protein
LARAVVVGLVMLLSPIGPTGRAWLSMSPSPAHSPRGRSALTHQLTRMPVSRSMRSTTLDLLDRALIFVPWYSRPQAASIGTLSPQAAVSLRCSPPGGLTQCLCRPRLGPAFLLPARVCCAGNPQQEVSSGSVHLYGLFFFLFVFVFNGGLRSGPFRLLCLVFSLSLSILFLFLPLLFLSVYRPLFLPLFLFPLSLFTRLSLFLLLISLLFPLES